MERDKAIDIAKGFAIILMVLGHCRIDMNLRLWIYSFHMPLFFFISGYFFKQQNSYSLFRKLFKQLIIPYLLTYIALTLFALEFTSIDYAIKQMGGVIYSDWGSNRAIYQTIEVYHEPVWFLMALFWCKLIYNEIYRLNLSHKTIIFVSIMILAWQIGYRIINLPFCLLSGICATVFYHAGHKFRVIGFSNIRPICYFCGLVLWSLTILSGSLLDMASFVYMKFPLTIVTGIVATIIVLKLSYLVKGKLVNYLAFFGKYSLEILIANTLAGRTRKFFVDNLLQDNSCILNNFIFSMILITTMYALTLIIAKNIIIKLNAHQ